MANEPHNRALIHELSVKGVNGRSFSCRKAEQPLSRSIISAFYFPPIRATAALFRCCLWQVQAVPGCVWRAPSFPLF